jgi:hypothetical protein
MKCVFFNYRDKSVGEDETMKRITISSIFILVVTSWIMSETSISAGKSALFPVNYFSPDGHSRSTVWLHLRLQVVHGILVTLTSAGSSRYFG